MKVMYRDSDVNSLNVAYVHSEPIRIGLYVS